ncbi:MAG: phosphatidate cytidylyltransferase [Miniphocaeibacter sp.]|uniref:phosphatidate cytidylyltransferase n=1 Tax=Miniphocaeibacter sp. TaxID=3100973 RepID=UPI001834C7C6|nr:phosphatidate cytidylyltransferase [Gallicola sp.]
MKNLIIRALTGIVLVAVLIGFTILGKTYLLFLSAFLSLVGIYEFFNIMKKLEYKPNYLLAFIFSLLLLLTVYFGYTNIESSIILVYTLFVMIMMTFFDLFDHKTAFLQIFVVTYITLSFSRLILLSGSVLIWLVYITSWGTDTFAYLVGSVFGKHKLIEKLSPKKSIEGAIGGVIGAAILTYIFAIVFKLDNKMQLIIIASIGSVISQIGDLCASKFKRLSDTKDYGTIFLGHGGVLDRFDSVLFTAPYIYLIYSFL